VGTLPWMPRKRAHQRVSEHVVDLAPLVLALIGVALILYFWA
jgi:hypothetical protein